jgi:hypothetical protein
VPLQNRVTPEGCIIATPHRGLMLGNRGGCLHSHDKTLGSRRWVSKQWIACVLSFRGRHREVMQPNRYTELFFLDEATALSAGHRPCFECRRGDACRFAALWGETHGPAGFVRAPQMDEVLQAQRVGPQRSKQTHLAPLAALPDGTCVRHSLRGAPGRAYLVAGDLLLAWTPGGYAAAIPKPPLAHIEVLTPPSIVAVLSAGYRPMLHPSAATWRGGKH